MIPECSIRKLYLNPGRYVDLIVKLYQTYTSNYKLSKTAYITKSRISLSVKNEDIRILFLIIKLKNIDYIKKAFISND